MNIKIKRVIIGFAIAAAMLLPASIGFAQSDKTPKKRLQIPATAKGFIGGESHDGYVINASKGQTITIQISWQREDGNKASFTVSKSANFFNGDPVKFGKESLNGKRWTGKIPKTGKYYIYVVANPSAKYTLKISGK
jgi:hypothetical protein